jgi:arylsulfatase A-like enzyme
VLPDDTEPGGIPRYQALPGLDRLAQYRSRYAGEIAYFDASFGHLLEAIARRGRPNVVALTADHGEAFGENGFYLSHGHATTPDQAHVPLLLRGPGLEPGRRREPVHHVDVAPTLLELAGLPVPSDARGLALGPRLRSGSRLPERLLFCDVGSDVSAYAGDRFLRASRSDPRQPFQFSEQRWDGAAHWEPMPSVPEDLARLDAYLARSERMRPIPETLSEGDRARLRALGYLDDASAAKPHAQ